MNWNTLTTQIKSNGFFIFWSEDRRQKVTYRHFAHFDLLTSVSRRKQRMNVGRNLS